MGMGSRSSRELQRKEDLLNHFWSATEPTESELKCVRELAAKLKEKQVGLPASIAVNGDETRALVRFVRARQGVLHDAEAMVLEMRRWRAEKKTDTVLDAPLGTCPGVSQPTKESVIRACVPNGVHGYDKQGRPIYFERLGKLRFKAMTEQGVTPTDFVHHHVQFQEYMANVCFTEASRRAGFTVDKFTYVMDMKGLSLSVLNTSTFSAFKEICRIDQNYYPETLGIMLIVNAPTVFSVFWSTCKSFVHPNTRAKIKIVRPNKTPETLLQYVDADVLPVDLGGTFTGLATSTENGHVTTFHTTFDSEVRRRASSKAASSSIRECEQRAPAPCTQEEGVSAAPDIKVSRVVPTTSALSDAVDVPRGDVEVVSTTTRRAADDDVADARVDEASPLVKVKDEVAPRDVSTRHALATFFLGVFAGALSASACFLGSDDSASS